MTFRTFIASAAAGVLLAGSMLPAHAESLAGSEGHKRYPIYIPGGSKDACSKAYKAYVAVNRHAAYAQSVVGGFNAEAFFCSIAAGATTAAAEKEAVARCNSLGKRYKVKVTGTCKVYASK